MKRLKQFISALVVAVIFYFLISNLIKNWQKIPFNNLHFNFINLIISFVFLFINFLIFVEGWRNIIIKLGDSIDFKSAFWIMSVSQTAKYVPGGIWFALGRIHLGKRENLSAEKIGLSVIIETVLTFLVGIIIFIFSTFFGGYAKLNNFIYIIPALIFFLIIIYPPHLNWLTNFCLKIVKRSPINIAISYFDLLNLSIYFLGLWIAQIIGFYFLISSIYSINFNNLTHLAATYTLSWMSGFIIIFAPGGLGVREGIMSLLLSSFIPSPLAIAISFLSRVWITVFEIVVFFIGLAIHKFSRNNNF
ncbi:MAG: lysylphosphatidylglycerol synthase domain-containing protein [Bacteroidales bacterium]